MPPRQPPRDDDLGYVRGTLDSFIERFDDEREERRRDARERGEKMDSVVSAVNVLTNTVSRNATEAEKRSSDAVTVAHTLGLKIEGLSTEISNLSKRTGSLETTSQATENGLVALKKEVADFKLVAGPVVTLGRRLISLGVLFGAGVMAICLTLWEKLSGAGVTAITHYLGFTP